MTGDEQESEEDYDEEELDEDGEQETDYGTLNSGSEEELKRFEEECGYVRV